MKNQYLLFIIILLFIASCNIHQHYFKNTKKRNYALAGQTAPPDMIFIEGNGDIEPFYMSATEEPNINYVIYLKWLRRVFDESYPEVLLDALPKSVANDPFLTYNDPYLQSYLTHPAFAYYPVTGLTWEQIQNYLVWKTDRLNEQILIKNGILNNNLYQQDEDNFNTEAYLLGQYEGDVRRNLLDENPDSEYGERAVLFKDGVLFTGFRLPTETEWEYAKQQHFQSPKATFYKGKKHPHHPYGRNYYTLNSGRDEYIYEKEIVSYHQSFLWYQVDAKHYESTNYDIYTNSSQQRMGNIPTSYGLINMEGGAREWLIDKYETEYQYEPDWKKVYQKAGYDVGLKVGQRIEEKYRTDDYEFVEKDSLGRMKYFRYMDVNEEGKPYEVGYLYNPKYVLAERKYLETKDYIRQNSYRNSTFTNSKHGKLLIERLNKERKEMYELPKFMSKDSYARVVKGGTWQHPSSTRCAMSQDSAAVDVGFRCILPFTGLTVRKGLKVRW